MNIYDFLVSASSISSIWFSHSGLSSDPTASPSSPTISYSFNSPSSSASHSESFWRHNRSEDEVTSERETNLGQSQLLHGLVSLSYIFGGGLVEIRDKLVIMVTSRLAAVLNVVLHRFVVPADLFLSLAVFRHAGEIKSVVVSCVVQMTVAAKVPVRELE